MNSRRIQPHADPSRKKLKPPHNSNLREANRLLDMASNSQISTVHQRLFAAAESGADLSAPWQQFAAAAVPQVENPPLHLATAFKLANQLKAANSDRDIQILDHGCGGAVTLLLLLAAGYRGIYGIDMPAARCEALNRITREIFGIPEQRFFRYDGQKLPFADRSFDLVFSQQVVEHVRDRDLQTYYAEEGRVLRQGGFAYHQVPHRFVPYDTHSRTWLLHWLPRRAQMEGYKMLGRNASYLDSMLFLRSPQTHKKLTKQHIGPITDLTAERLGHMPEASKYDGPLGMRRLIHRVVSIPVLGTATAAALSNLVMLETVARKS